MELCNKYFYLFLKGEKIWI